MIRSPKDWASLLGFDKDWDERTLAARARMMCGVLGFLDRHFADPDGERPSETVIMEFGQYLALAVQKVGASRAEELKELYSAAHRLHAQWEAIERDEEFKTIAEHRAVLRGFVRFADAWLGTSLLPEEPEPAPRVDVSDAKTRLVRRSL